MERKRCLKWEKVHLQPKQVCSNLETFFYPQQNKADVLYSSLLRFKPHQLVTRRPNWRDELKDVFSFLNQPPCGWGCTWSEMKSCLMSELWLVNVSLCSFWNVNAILMRLFACSWAPWWRCECWSQSVRTLIYSFSSACRPKRPFTFIKPSDC